MSTRDTRGPFQPDPFCESVKLSSLGIFTLIPLQQHDVCLSSSCASTCQLSPANFEPSAQCQCNLTEAKKPYFLQRIHRHHGLGGIIRLREIIITQEKLHCHRSKNSSGPKSTQNQLQQICPFFSFFLTNGSLPVTRLSLENCKGQFLQLAAIQPPAHKKIDHTASNHPKDRALLPLALLRESTNLLTKRIGLQE